MCQAGSNESECLLCAGKDLTIDKYVHLTTLLKKKISKYEGIATKKYNDCKPSVKLNIGSSLTLLVLADKFISRRLRIGLQSLKQQTINTSYACIAGMASIRRNQDVASGVSQQQNMDIASQKRLIHFQQLKTVQFDGIFPLRSISNKELSKINFSLTLEKQQLESKVKFLQLKMQEIVRRHEKETSKKRQSLEGLVEQLNEKNEMIGELKSTIKIMESKLGTREKEFGSCMLEEDSESLKKIVFRLENINDKLNIDLSKLNNEKIAQEELNRQYIRRNQQLQKEVKTLKEENFDYEQNNININIFKKELEIMSHKVNSKVERITKIERKIGNIARGKAFGSANIFETILEAKLDKRQTTESTEAVTIHGSGSAHDMEIESKLEAIFTYLFNIEDENYKITTPELFDEEEKQLLSSHKLRFINHRMTSNEAHQDHIQKEQLSETSINIFGDSVVEVLNDKCETHDHKNNFKLMQLEIEGRQMVQKIGELKEMHMHIRSVIHTFLKTLEPKSLKKQSEDIITVLCDFFEYSEEERHQFLQGKSKKLFGFI